MSNMQDQADGTLTASVATSFMVRSILVGLLCLVLGVWGVYDYFVAIPQQQVEARRAAVGSAFLLVAEPHVNGQSVVANDDAMPDFVRAVVNDLVDEDDPELKANLGTLKHLSDDDAITPATIEAVRSALLKTLNAKQEQAKAAPDQKLDDATRGRNEWFIATALMMQVAQAPLTVTGEPVEQLEPAMKFAGRAVDLWGDVTMPSKYDRPMQWMFILCLPFVPWYAVSAFKARKSSYSLDPDGTLHMPEGTWAAHDIADIDMSRWMAKSKAWVVHADGTRVLLDDYVYRGLFHIVGALASSRYPDAWTAQAKPVKADSADTEDDTEAQDGDSSTTDVD